MWAGWRGGTLAINGLEEHNRRYKSGFNDEAVAPVRLALVLVVAGLVFLGCGGKGESRQEKADKEICHAGQSMLADPGSSPILKLENQYASEPIEIAGQLVIRSISPGDVDPEREPLRSALAELRRTCGDRW